MQRTKKVLAIFLVFLITFGILASNVPVAAASPQQDSAAMWDATEEANNPDVEDSVDSSSPDDSITNTTTEGALDVEVDKEALEIAPDSGSQQELVAEWDITEEANNPEIPATDGANREGAVLTARTKRTNGEIPEIQWNTASGLFVDGWAYDRGMRDKSWQISLSSAGYENLELSALTGSDSNGPRDFSVWYSTDGENFSNVADSAYHNTTSIADQMEIVSLPADASDVPTLVIQIRMYSSINVLGGSTEDTAYSYIRDIHIMGTPTDVTPEFDKAALEDAINNAQDLLDTTEEGIAPGQYPKAVRNALKAAINAAIAVRDNAEATQEQVDAAVTALNTAVETYISKVTRAMVAMWALNSDPAAQSVPASGGDNKDGALLTVRTPIGIRYYAGNVHSYNWQEDAAYGSKYWQISLSTAGFEDIRLTANTSSYTNGPKDFVIKYSTDGENFTDVPGGAYQNTTSLGNRMGTVSLPEDAYDTETLTVRFQVVGNATVGGYPAIDPGGLSIMKGIQVTGMPNDSVPETDKTALEDAIDVAQAIYDAAIVGTQPGQYSQVAKNGLGSAIAAAITIRDNPDVTQWQVDSAVTALEAAVEYFENSVVPEPDVEVGPVTATPASGAINEGDTITISTATEGAVIKYSINDGTYQTYTAPFAITTFPATVKAYAEKGGVQGDISTFTYTQKTSVGMTIAEARALPIGTQVTIRGVVTRSIPSSSGNQGNCTVFIQDETAGIGIFNMSAFSPTTYAPGTTLIVSGSIGEYNGLLEIQYDAVVTVDTSVPVTPVVPEVITVAELMTGDYQGRFVKIVGAELKSIGSSSNHIIEQDGIRTTLRNTGHSTLLNYKVGDIIDVVGVAGIYGGAPQLLVESEKDIGGLGAAVKANPGSGVIKETDKITLTARDAGAVIRYSINDGEEQTYAEPFSITTFPATVKAYAIKDGKNSDTVTFTYVKADEGGILTIANARLLFGQNVTVQGVVTRAIHSSAGNQNNATVFIQDNTGGIGVYKSNSYTPSTYPRGTTLKITGPVGEYNGLVEISPPTSVTTVPGTPAEFEPLPITAAQLLTGQYQGQLVKIEGATIINVATDSNHMIKQGADSVTMRCTSAGSLAKFKAGDAIDVVGIAGEYQGTQQLLVESEEDIAAGTAAAQVAPVKAEPDSGNAEIGDEITLSTATEGATIHYSLDNGVTFQVYEDSITITKLPQRIFAYAAKAELLDSDMAVFLYKKEFTGEYTPYFGQLHSHTNISDGVGSIEEAYQYASQANNVDFLAVTDHSNSFDDESTATMAGSSGYEWNLAHNMADQYTTDTFVGIYGFEMTWSNGKGHINTYNTPGFESRNNTKFKGDDGLQQYYNILKKFPDSFSQFNHPGTTFGYFDDFGYYDPIIDNLIPLIEVGNGEGPIRGAGYYPSYEYYTRALDKGWHVAPSNNQDNHKGRWGNSNTGRTVVLAEELTRDAIYDAIRSRRVYATEDHNLSIQYTLDDQIMGSSIDAPADGTVTLRAVLEDPDGEGLGKASVIVNGGIVADSKTLTAGSDTVTFDLPADYTYYYIRVDQADKDIAVTAPVWVGDMEKLGISQTTASTTMPIKGKEITITSDLYNNEESDFTVTGLTFSIGGSVLHTATGLTKVPALGTASYSFDHTFDKAGSYTIDVELKGLFNGAPKTFRGELILKVSDPASVTQVVIDATHYNDYVAGYYKGNTNSFIKLANGQNVAVNLETERLTDESLAGVQLLMITAPVKKGEYSPDGSPKTFSQETLDVIRRYVENGGNLIICSIADYQDGVGVYQSSTQINRLLTAIGATTRINNDEVVDYENAVNEFYRLAFNTYNPDAEITTNIESSYPYSFYSGCSLDIDEAAVAEGKVQWLVKGHETTQSVDSNSNLKGVALPKGKVYALAQERLSGGGTMYIGGTVFFSDFEVKPENSNYHILSNILNAVKKETTVTPIAEVRKAEKGQVFTVEGTVTAGTVPGNAFFDTAYIQDETGGINIFPVEQLIDGEPLKVGQKLRVTGEVDYYNGDLELRITGYDEPAVTDPGVNPIAPTTVSTKDSMDYAKTGGLLVKVTGTVTNIVLKSGVVEEIHVRDESGSEARIFLDGYIGYSDETSPKLETIKVGDTVTAVGLASMDTVGARIRVRDRSEVKAEAATSGINRAGITVEPVTVLGKDRTITFRISAENLQDIWTIDGTVKIEDTEHFTIKSVRSLVEGENVIFQANIGRYGEGTAYFLLAKVGGFEDAEKMDIAEVRIQMKEGATASSLEAILDSIHMYRGNADDHTAIEVDSEISKGSAVTQIHEGGIPGDLNDDGNVTALDLTISLTCFGLTSDDARWYDSRAWRADFDGNGVIDITDISKLAWLIVKNIR